MDALMMVFGGGPERAEEELAGLLERAGLPLARAVPTVTTLTIAEAVPA